MLKHYELEELCDMIYDGKIQDVENDFSIVMLIKR